MKKVFVTSVFIVSALFYGQAQIQGTTSMSSGDMRFGAKAGLNAATLAGNDLNYNVRPGFHVGGVVEIPFSDMFQIQPEVLLSLQGSGDDIDFGDNLNFTYLNVPVMVKYNVWDALNIEAGPQLGLLLGSNAEDFLDGNLNRLESNSIDFGLAAGAGYSLNDTFYFQARFTAGFINALDDIASKNRVFQVSAVYFF